jgi:hypothetical protein
MMTLKRSPARLAALVIGIIAVSSSCDTRLPTQATSAGGDVTSPQVTFNVTGGVNNAISLGNPLIVNVTASDNKGVTTVMTTVRNASQVIALDTATIKPAAVTTTRAVTVPLLNVKKGDRITVRTTVTDAALNTRVDSVVITIAAPSVTLLTPLVGAKLNVGDSLLVTARLHDDAGLKNVTFTAYTLRGSAALGTQDTIVRYPTITAPSATGLFAANVRDTVITRYLKATLPADTLTDSLVVNAVATDVLGGVDTARITVKVVRGPSVTVLSPIVGDSATPGAGLTVTLRATDPTGVARLGFRLQSDPTFPTKIDTTVIALYSGLPTDVTFSATVAIPANSPLRGVLTITPISTNPGGQDGASAPTLISIRTGLPPAPRVFQSIGARIETEDSITVTALGNGVKFVGYQLKDSLGAILKRDSVAIAQPYPSTAVVTIGLKLPSTAQGKRISLTSFAYDQGGRIGFSLPAGATTFQVIAANAFVDSTLVVYGKTYTLPGNRNGTIADLQVDAARGNVFLSNINFGRLEVWQGGAGGVFDPNGVVVGSQPWGMTMSRTAPLKDTMYVANSGGTNLSRVYIGGAAASMREDLQNRLVTRASYLFKLTEVRDASTSKIRITTTAPILFSDRPQYVEQSAAGRLYISTKPTAQAPAGTIRYMDPAAPAPDERFILDFAFLGTDPNSFVVANLDGVGVTPAPATSTANDLLTLCDHPSGSTAQPTCVSTTNGILATIAALQAAVPTTDVDYAVNIDFNSLGLQDTTYAASSGDGKWITFGEGHKSPVARNFILQDDGSVTNRFSYASPSLNVVDLMNNSSDQIFGLALDKTGKTIGVHGTETSFSAVTVPFTQRLQGKKSTFNQGAGIAFHPNADGVNTPQSDRLAFVASSNGSIEAVDIAYYDFTRGSLATKFNLYGPLRASLPFPGDDPAVVLKLFGITPKGLVVVNVTNADLKAGP